MSFWSQSPGPHWSDSFWSCIPVGVVYPHPLRNHKLDRPRAEICYQADETNAEEIAEFLCSYFQITEKSKCSITAERIQEGINNDWTVVIKLNEKKEIVGTIISRSLGVCTFHNGKGRNTRLPNTAYIDFFCVHPDYRNAGIGSDLLFWIEYYTNKKGIYVHFFQKELLPLCSIPPLWQGKYIVRENGNLSRNQNISKVKIQTFDHGDSEKFSISFRPMYKTKDSQLYFYDCRNFKIYVAFTNTYHTYNNRSIGELLFYKVLSDELISEKNIGAAIEEVIDNCPYNFILMDKTIPHSNLYAWKDDAPYYLYCYNVNPRHFRSVHPSFWF